MWGKWNEGGSTITLIRIFAPLRSVVLIMIYWKQFATILWWAEFNWLWHALALIRKKLDLSESTMYISFGKKIWKAFLCGLLVILIANQMKNHMPACEIYPSLYSINRWIFPLHYELYDKSTGYFKNWILFLILIYR